jgi:hypothetical protein
LLLASVFSNTRKSKIPESLRDSMFRDELVERRIARFQKSQSELSVISAEGLWDWNDEEFNTMMARFDADQAVVRVVLRDPWTWAGSFFQQHLKSGKANLRVPELSYRTVLQKFEKFNLEVFDFSPFLANPTIAPQLATKVFPELEIQAHTMPQNKGISWLAAIFLFRLNHSLEENHLEIFRGSRDRRTIKQVSQVIPGPKFKLDSSDVPWAKHQADFVRTRFGIDWKPSSLNHGHYSLLDFLSGMSKSDADVVREKVAPFLTELESKVLRPIMEGVLGNLEKETTI